MRIFLDEASGRHHGDWIVMAFDGAGWRRSKSLVVPENMRLLRLPPYSPELNPVESVWGELREKFFGNAVFDGMDALEERLLLGLRHLDAHPETTRAC
jgi:transposase